MGKREIIMADGDTRYRGQVTDFFRRCGYRVTTADSVEQVLASIQESQTQVLLLGNGFSTKISASDLIRLLKKCSRRLRIIMVSDGMTLAQVRQVRQEGIFYQALKPATASDTEELGQAVACAFEKTRGSVPGDPAAFRQVQPFQATLNEKSGVDGGGSSGKTPPWMLTLFVSASYYFLASAAEKVHNGTSLASWILLGFCAFLVAGQLLPSCNIELAPGRGAEHFAMQERTPRAFTGENPGMIFKFN